MMRRISARLCIAVVLATWWCLAVAKTDSDCLKHLGGGYGDTICFGWLTNDLVAESANLYRQIRAKIPHGNVHVQLLDDYMKTQDQSVRFCELQRNAGADWQVEHDGSMYPAIAAQCVYELRKAQHKFLKDTLDMANW